MEIISFDIWDKFDDLLPPLDFPGFDSDFQVVGPFKDFERLFEPDVSEDFPLDGPDNESDPLHDHSYASMVLSLNQDQFQTRTNNKIKKRKNSLGICSISENLLKNVEVFLSSSGSGSGQVKVRLGPAQRLKLQTLT